VQEVFSRARLREVGTSYWKDSNPTGIRKAIAGEDICSTQIYARRQNAFNSSIALAAMAILRMEVARPAAHQDRRLRQLSRRRHPIRFR
jgi:hypothetical protein